MRILIGGGGVVGRVCASPAILALGGLLGVAPGGPAIAQSPSEATHGGGGGQGPSLAGVVGRKAAAADFPYSRALRGAGLTWTQDQLDRYLADPQALVPGTSVPVTVPSADERHALIAYLATLKAPQDGVPTSEYEDFLRGFIIDDRSVWGRPVGIAVAHDGAPLVAEDGNDTVWRIAYVGAEP